MDVDYLSGRKRISLLNAAAAACPEARKAHEKLAQAYASRLANAHTQARSPRADNET
jgi:hypothetical protein